MDMNRKNRNNFEESNMFMDRLMAEKKKGILAIGLILVMVFMWVKALRGKGPDGAEAALLAQTANSAANQVPQLKISFKPLPQVPGRNDVLSRDFFDGSDFEDFILEGENSGVNEKDSDSNSDVDRSIRNLADKLTLGAICAGSNPQAFINDKLLAVGDKLIVGDKDIEYECEVTEIGENQVKVKYLESAITLKLPQPIEPGR